MPNKYHDPFYEGFFYHVYNRSNNDEIIFKSRRNYRFFFERWQVYLDELVDVYSYCLLPTHFHIFIRVRELTEIPDKKLVSLLRLDTQFKNSNLSIKQLIKQQELDWEINSHLVKQFKIFFESYSLSFNAENNRHGSLFQKGFKRIQIKNDRHFMALIRYIHKNPRHHKCLFEFENWEFSSYKAILSHQPTKVRRSEVLSWFGDVQDFIHFHNQDSNDNEINYGLLE